MVVADPPLEESSSDHSNIGEGTTSFHSGTFSKDFTYLQKIHVILKNGNASIQTNAVLDNRSEKTLIHQKMVHQLKLKTSFKEN